jgi:hypothetical protein
VAAVYASLTATMVRSGKRIRYKPGTDSNKDRKLTATGVVVVILMKIIIGGLFNELYAG